MNELIRSLTPFPLFNEAWYRRSAASLDLERADFLHYLTEGWRKGRSPHPLFSVNFYLDLRADVRNSGVEPLGHFVRRGWKERFSSPHPLVNIAYYLAQNPNLEGLDPLSHYITIGWQQGLRMCPDFDPIWYAQNYADVCESGLEPLTHYLLFGLEGARRPAASMDAELFVQRYGNIAILDLAPISVASEFVQKISLVPCNKPEPGVRPEPLIATLRGDVSAHAQKCFRIFQAFQARAKGTAGEATNALLSAKLHSLGKDSSLPNKLLSDDVASSLSMRDRVISLNLVPSRAPTRGQANYSLPFLNNYNKERLEATARFSFEPDSAGKVDGPIRVTVLVPVFRAPLAYLERAILSVAFQTYKNWELVLVDDCSDNPELRSVLEYYAAVDPRIKVVFQSKNGGISAASNAGLEQSTGDYIGLLDHDDMLTRDALEKIVRVLQKPLEIDFVYSDECKIDIDDVADDIFSKPDWSPYLLFNMMYTGHFTVYRKALIADVGGFRSQYDFSQDYDLALRVAEKNAKVFHIDEILYGWRMIAGSAAVGDKPAARESNIGALQSALDRRGLGGVAERLLAANRARRPVASPAPLVSVIVPSDNAENIALTITSIVENTVYENYEILIVTNSKIISQRKKFGAKGKVRFIAYDRSYNFSDKCNVGAHDAKGLYLAFFNDDVRVVSKDWIESILEVLTLPGVGVVGPKLLYEDGTIQHAGMLTGVRRLVGTAFHAYPSWTTAHANFAQSVRETSVICGALLAISKELFDHIGGFDPANAGIAHSDVDLCFRVRETGKACVYTPHAELIHIGHVSIGQQEVKAKEKPFKQDKADIYLMRRWGSYCARDPYFPPKMRDILYLDSQEPFHYFPGKLFSDGGKDVLIFSHDLSGSGAPKIVSDLAELFLRAGCFVLVMSPEDGPMRERLVKMGAHVIVDPLALSGNHNVTDLGKNFDVIIANTIVCWPVIEQFSRFNPVYWYIHETELIRHFEKHFPPFMGAFGNARAVWTGSALSSAYVEKFGARPVVVPYGVDAPPTRPAATAPRGNARIRISALATLEPRKGQDLALKGFLQLPPEIRAKSELYFAGRVNDANFAQALREIAGNAKDVFFDKALNYEDYLSALRQSDIFLCPSRDDTLPLATLDALAEGKVLICSKTTGTSSFLENDISGLVLEENSPDEIAARLTSLISDMDKAAAISERAKEVFKRNFTRSHFSERIAEVLEEQHFDVSAKIRATSSGL